MTTRPGLADRNIQFFVLLLCPSRLYIDLVAITVDDLALRDDSTIWDVLESIQMKCAEKRLLENQYVGFVRISDQVIFTDLDARAFRRVDADGGDPSGGGQEYIEEHDVLVAVLEGHSAHGMIELAEPVLRNPDFAEAIGQSFVWRLMPKATTGRTSRGHGIRGDASRKSTTNNSSDGQNETDYLDESESRGLTLGHQKYSDEEPRDGGASAGRGIFEPIADYLGNTIDFAPTFNSRGQFTHHESRGMLDHDAQSATSSSVLSGRSAAEELWDVQDQMNEMAPNQNSRVSRRAVVFTLLMLFVAVSAIFLAGLTKQVSIPISEEQLVGKPVQSEGVGAAATPHVAEDAPRPTKRPVSSSNFAVLADAHMESSTESTSTPTNRPTPSSPFTQADVSARTESPSQTEQQTHPWAESATSVPTEAPVRTENNFSDGILAGKTKSEKDHSGRHSSTPTPKPTHKRHTHSDGLPTGKPTHKKHDHDARQSSAPTPKPTHKRHNHSDRLPTGKPTHKKHDHDNRQSSVPTPKPTHKRHNHSDRLPTGKPTHKKHDHDARQSSAPTPEPTHKRHDHPDSLPTGEPTHEEHDHFDGHNSTSASPEAHVDDAEASATASDPIHIKPRGLATVDRSNPDFKLGGLEQLGVERDESVSFLHFGLASIAGAAVASATLNLYLTSYEDDDTSDEGEVAFAVDMLPRAGDWSVGSVSWNEPPDAGEPFPVDYLMVDYLTVQTLRSASPEEEPYAVRVTSALVRARQLGNPSVTFRLSTESGGRLYFASKQWKGGELMPELVVTLEE